MTASQIREVVKQAVARVAKIDPRTIGDHASFQDDLRLDSLSFLEAVVDVQYRFQIPDDGDLDIRIFETIDDVVAFVQRQLAARQQPTLEVA